MGVWEKPFWLSTGMELNRRPRAVIHDREQAEIFTESLISTTI
jgi:hypothetical protein